MIKVPFSENKTAVIVIVGGFFAIVGIVTFLLAIHYFFTGINLACR